MALLLVPQPPFPSSFEENLKLQNLSLKYFQKMTQSWRNGVRKKRKTEDTKHQQTMMDAPSPPGAQKLPSSEDRSRNADIPAANADQASLMENAQITTATDFAIIENGSTEAVGASSSSSRQLLYRSPEFSELSGCGCVAAVAILIRKLPISPNQRGFPVQYLENSDEYVLNQSYNEPLVGDTVSNATFIIVGIVLPFVVVSVIVII